MKRVLFFWMAGLLALGTLTAQNAPEARLLRFPTTNGNEIVFTYAGDLYRVSITGGQAQRLTSHIGYEMFARYSPDGKTIAFTGQYDGNTEVFTIPSTGGEPLRLTYTATNKRDDLSDRMGPNNIVTAWHPSGKHIVFRNRISSGFDGKLYTVDADGGMPQVIPLPEGGFCSYSPDGKQLAYNRVMREFRTWKYYKGGMADDVWIYSPESNSVVNITNNPAQDIFPMWIGNEIYYLSDRDRTMNLFVYDTQTKQTAKVTDFTDFDIKFPSFNGNTIVFEKGGFIYTFDATSKKSEKVRITLASDNIYARGEVKEGEKNITAVSISPNGERAVITARGEVFDVPVTQGVTRNITRSAGANDRNAQWSPDGKWIAYISDATGETELYIREAVSAAAPVQLTKNNNTYIRGFEWSPDASRIFYTDRKNQLNEVEIASRKATTLLKDDIGEFRGVSVSPDNRWLTYIRTLENNVSAVFVYDRVDKKEFMVTDKWYDAAGPRFSNDGKYLFFTSSRDFNPTYGSTEWNHVYNNMDCVYFAILSNDVSSPFLEKDDLVTFSDAKKVDKKSDSIASKNVRIDTGSFADRIYRLPIAAGNYRVIWADGERVFYGSRGAVKMFTFKDSKEETILDGGSMSISYGAKKALVAKQNKYYVADIPKGKMTLNDPINTGNLKIATDYTAEWAQIFDEAWRHMRDGFYVENMHGVDWKAMKKKYAVLLPYVKNRLDLNYVIGEMIGELNCGHAYINAGEADRPERISTGMLGAEISLDKSGFFRIEKILPGANWSKALRSPLTESGLNVKVGEYIVAVDGVTTGGVKNFYELLVGKAGIPTELTINSQPTEQGARKVVIKPLEEEYSLYHYNWVQNNIRKVEEASGGKVGYIYIPDMGVDGLNEFSRYFYPQLDKEALIIDDRANGGGNVSPMILERLSREPYRVTMRRGSTRVGTVPDAVQYGPKVCLINKYSASDGDLFPWGFRALGLGKLIGVRTWGGIVGISGSLPFIDGTDLRVPFFTSFDPKTGDWIIENHGVDPDIEIDNDPIKEWNGEDQQLNRAIEEMMKEIKTRKPLPGIPTPRNWSK